MYEMSIFHIYSYSIVVLFNLDYIIGLFDKMHPKNITMRSFQIDGLVQDCSISSNRDTAVLHSAIYIWFISLKNSQKRTQKLPQIKWVSFGSSKSNSVLSESLML